MAEDSQNQQDDDDKSHRGRVQAQGGGTEKSEPWAEKRPASVSFVLGKVDLLERNLTPKEQREREQPFMDVRKYIRNAARSGGIWAQFKKSFNKRGSSDIRVDLEVHKGQACIPDPSAE